VQVRKPNENPSTPQVNRCMEMAMLECYKHHGGHEAKGDYFLSGINSCDLFGGDLVYNFFAGDLAHGPTQNQ